MFINHHNDNEYYALDTDFPEMSEEEAINADYTGCPNAIFGHGDEIPWGCLQY